MTATMTRRASRHRYIQDQQPGVVSFNEPRRERPRSDRATGDSRTRASTGTDDRPAQVLASTAVLPFAGRLLATACAASREGNNHGRVPPQHRTILLGRPPRTPARTPPAYRSAALVSASAVGAVPGSGRAVVGWLAFGGCVGLKVWVVSAYFPQFGPA